MWSKGREHHSNGGWNCICHNKIRNSETFTSGEVKDNMKQYVGDVNIDIIIIKCKEYTHWCEEAVKSSDEVKIHIQL